MAQSTSAPPLPVYRLHGPHTPRRTFAKSRRGLVSKLGSYRSPRFVGFSESERRPRHSIPLYRTVAVSGHRRNCFWPPPSQRTVLPDSLLLPSALPLPLSLFADLDIERTRSESKTANMGNHLSPLSHTHTHTLSFLFRSNMHHAGGRVGVRAVGRLVEGRGGTLPAVSRGWKLCGLPLRMPSF